jgi:hypothetical protein
MRVPEFGRIAGERDVLMAGAGVTLRARGLAGERGPLGIAAEVVTALREYRGTIDLVLAAPEASVAFVALVYRSWALICRQPLTGDPATNGVRVRRVAQSALADELCAMVPELESAVTMPITIRPDADEFTDFAVLDELGRLLPELSGTGQLGGSRRDGGRCEIELSWLDGPRGRVRMHRAEDGWTSVNALRQNELRYAVDALTKIARREDDGSAAVARAV